MALQEAFLEVGDHKIYTWYKLSEVPRADKLTLVILHGAGKSYSERFMNISQHFLDAGVSVVGLDFVGHGKTGGDMSDSSLDLRNTYTLAAIDHWLKPDNPLVLLGSSMGGHTALRLASTLGVRAHGLCLLQPAIYAREAEAVPFTEEFTKVLRQPGSWRNSSALHDAENFDGRVFIGIGSEDVVIPWGVIESLTGAFRTSARALRLEVFHGAGHDLPEWLPERPLVCQQMATFFTES